MIDISGDLSVIIAMIVTGFVKSFQLLDSIGFFGISLLDFIITIFILGVIVPLILTLLKADTVFRMSERRRTKTKRGNSDEG